MKKFLSIVLALSMIFAMSITAFAAETNQQTKIVTQNGYTFKITESFGVDYAVNREYVNQSANTRAIPGIEKTIALLLALGMSEDHINSMSESTLQEYATAKNISVTTAYTKHNEDTNQTIGLPAEVAISEAAILSQQQTDYLLNSEKRPTTRGNIENESTIPGQFKDSYMTITHAAAHNGGGSYTYTTSATWLTMPFFRGFDSIGSCAKGGSATPFSGKGHYSYTTKLISNGKITTQNSGNISISKTQAKINGDWYGYAGIFDLPNDIRYENMGYFVLHSNLKAYFEYKGNVTNPQLITNFNTNGTYSHATIAIAVDPSVSIDTNGTMSASIGLKVMGSSDDRVAPLEVRYVP